MPSIDEFKALVTSRSGLAMANRYLVVLNVPPKVQDAANIATADINLLCDATHLPGRQIGTIDYTHHRHPRKAPIGYINEDVSMTWTLTNDYAMKYLFDSWLGLVVDAENFRAQYSDDYVADVFIYQLDKNDEVSYGVQLMDAYPITSNGIDLANTSENTPVKYTVVLTYNDFKVLPSTYSENFIESILSTIQSVKNVGGELLGRTF